MTVSVPSTTDAVTYVEALRLAEIGHSVVAQEASDRDAASSPLMYSDSSIPSYARPAACRRDQAIRIARVRTSQPTAIAVMSTILHPSNLFDRDNASRLVKGTDRAG